MSSKDAATHEEYLVSVEEPKRSELRLLDDLIRTTLPDHEPFMISGFMGYGKYHYRYDSGREGDWFKVGMVANKTGISVYVVAADENGYLAEQFKPKLGKASIGKSCIRFKKLADIDLGALKELLIRAKDAEPAM